jgi:membrane protease YdiL (CAAX protease family)
MAAAVSLVVGVGLATTLWFVTLKRHVTATGVWHLDLVIGATAGVLTCVGVGHGRELLDRSFLLARPSAIVVVTVAVSAQIVVIAVNALLALASRGVSRPSLRVRPLDYTRTFRPETLPVVAPIAALAEEAVFRGVLLPCARSHSRRWLASAPPRPSGSRFRPPPSVPYT